MNLLKNLFLVSFILITFFDFAQNAKITGTVKDIASTELLIGAKGNL
jgi:hypothetical protein